MASKTEETAVRAYLESLNSKNWTSPEVERLEKELETESDVLKRAKLQQQLIDEREGTSLEQAFVQHAKAWATENGVTARALAAMSVPSGVLSQAGFDVGDLSTARGASKTTKPRAKRVSRDAVEEYINRLRKGTTFSVTTVKTDVGGSDQTIRTVLTENDKVQEVGPDPDHTGRGRAPMLYVKA